MNETLTGIAGLLRKGNMRTSFAVKGTIEKNHKWSKCRNPLASVAFPIQIIHALKIQGTLKKRGKSILRAKGPDKMLQSSLISKLQKQTNKQTK